VQEPGLDAHVWEAQWVALEPELADAPAEALPEVDRLITEMLEGRGEEGELDVELEGELDQAQAVTERLEAGEDVDPGDLGAAVRAYRTLYEQLLREHDLP
jgi:hypothetical protein